MIAVQSLWTGARANDPQNPAAWRLSNSLIRRHYPGTVFFGDGKATAWARSIGLEYDEWHEMPEFPTGVERVWGLGKLWAASQMREPFIHVDGDAFIGRPLPVWGAAFFAQEREMWVNARGWWEVLGFGPMPAPEKVWSYNFGVFGGSAWQEIAAACRAAVSCAVSNRLWIEAACRRLFVAVIVEQVWVPALLAASGIPCRTLLRPFARRTDATALNYWHPSGPEKNSPETAEKIALQAACNGD